jgi:hypothetical protein
MKKGAITKGWKVFDKDLKCRGFQYEIGKRFKQTGTLKLCGHGFHFHTEKSGLFNYYEFDPNNRVCEILAHGEVITDVDKSCCNDIEIIKELTWNDVLTLINVGKGNSGRNNSGDQNSGNQNSGNWNSGNRNSGDQNSGNQNSGNQNSGYRNSGHQNSGNQNSGYRNSGHQNSGDQNSGYQNSGFFNKTNYCAGMFNSQEQPVPLFNGAASVLMSEFQNTPAFNVMVNRNFPLTEWIYDSDMTDDQKKENPKFFVAGGFLKVNTYEYSCSEWWKSLDADEKKLIRSLPGFSAKIFKEVTGIMIK